MAFLKRYFTAKSAKEYNRKDWTQIYTDKNKGLYNPGTPYLFI
jgi:hypothetical protein